MPIAITTPHDLSATPTHVLRSARYVRVYWEQDPTATPDSFGCTPHTTLTFSHESGQYRAILSSVPASFRDGTHREALTFAARPERHVLSSELAPRYSAKRFAAFVRSLQPELSI